MSAPDQVPGFEQLEPVGSPLFWFVDALDSSLLAEHARRRAQQMFRNLTPQKSLDYDCFAAAAGRFAASADESWRRFCGVWP